MRNWSDNDNQKLKINKDRSISEIIPKEIIKGYKITEIYLTTFSFDEDSLYEVLYSPESIEGLLLADQGKVHVFYDKYARKMKQDDRKIISEKYLHSIEIKENGRLYAFHPKVILCRYVKEHAAHRYVMIISSKNISDSNLLEAYAVTYGDVSEQIVKENESVLFWEKIFKKSNFENDDVIKELATVSFVQDGSEQVQFYQVQDVWNEVGEKDEIIVISPFLSGHFLQKLQAKNIMIVSTANGYSKIQENIILEILHETRYKLLFSEDSLHAKVYCYPKDGKTGWIIGSSNATNNGCGVNTASKNMEFNIGFSTDADDYEQFKQLMESSFKSLELADWFEAIDYEDTFDARECYSDFLGCVNISCESDESYTCNIELKAGCIFDKKEYKVEIGQIGSLEFRQFTGQKITFKSNKPISRIGIRVSRINDSNSYREFALSLYDLLDERGKSFLDSMCSVAFDELLLHIQKQICEGRNGGAISSRTNDRTGNRPNTRRSINKVRSYETILKLFQNERDDEKRRELINQLYEISEYLLKKDENDDQQQEMKRLIENLEKAW